MAKKRGKKAKEVGRRAAHRWPPDLVPTGSDMTSHGSSVLTDSGLATREEIPSTEEILRKAEEARRKGKPHEAAAPPHAEPRGAPEEEGEEETLVPHDKGPLQEIE